MKKGGNKEKKNTTKPHTYINQIPSSSLTLKKKKEKKSHKKHKPRVAITRPIKLCEIMK